MVARSLSKVEVSWDDAWSGHFPEPSARQLFTQTVLLVAAQAKAALPEATGRVERARDLVLGGAVLRNAEGTFTVRSQSRRGKSYTVAENTCDCPDAQKGQPPCKHVLASWLWRKARRVLAAQRASEGHGPHPAAPPAAVSTAAEAVDVSAAAETNGAESRAAVPTATLPVPAQLLVALHGKRFVTFAGLLAMAHERGLVRLKADFITVTAELALAHAVATFQDGRTFEESADATPANVNARVKVHYPRMALTRAKARALCAVKAA